MEIFEGHTVKKLVKLRRSVRTYDPKPLNEEIKEKIRGLIAGAKGPWGAPLRIVLIDTKAKETGSNGAKVGTYGVIKGASSYLTAMIPKDQPGSVLELGYVLERVVLGATALGLGTCWLAGTFNRGQFAEAAGLKEEETLPIVSPIGYPAAKKSLTERVMRLATGADNRKPWADLFFDSSYGTPLTPGRAGVYSKPLEMLRLAPSGGNGQPWRAIKESDGYSFYLLHKGSKPSAMGEMHKIDLGIGLCHFELTAQEAGLTGRWSFENAGQIIPAGGDSLELIASWKI